MLLSWTLCKWLAHSKCKHSSHANSPFAHNTIEEVIHVHDVRYLSEILQVLLKKKKIINIWSPELNNVKQLSKLLVLLEISRET